MKTAVNIQPALHGGKSGIGYYTDNILSRLIKNYPGDRFILNYFDPGGSRAEAAKRYSADNAVCEPCLWLSATLYHLIWTFIPVPYSLFFKGSPHVSLFFNYYLPPFVKGKRVLVVYDTVIKDCPETMSVKTRTMLTLTLGRSIKRADRIITISEFSKSRIMEHYGVPESKIAVIPCGLDKSRFYPVTEVSLITRVREKYGINSPYYLYLGNLEPRKNISRLIEAYSKAGKMHPELPKLVLAGIKGWGYEDIFRNVEKYGLTDRVIFTGYAEDGDVPLLINGAQAFCFPSLYEGFGLPPLEAMACGVPVITSNTSSLPEVVGDCGITVDPYDTDSMAEALIRVLEPEWADRLRMMGMKRAEKFSWDESVRQLHDVLEELVNE